MTIVEPPLRLNACTTWYIFFYYLFLDLKEHSERFRKKPAISRA